MEAACVGTADGTGGAVIRGVDWVVRTGEAWVLAGPMNAGKSALLETVAGLRVLASGRLEVMGQRWEGLKGDALVALRRRVGLVFEGRGRVFPGLTVFENVALPLCYHGNATLQGVAAEVEEWLSEAGLSRWALEPAGRLNPAWARRVALMRALVLRPDLLLLDEPLAGLDPSHARWWQDYLERLRGGHPRLGCGGLTLAMTASTPGAMPEWRSHARCAVMDQGQWRVVGGLRDLASLNQPWLAAGETQG
jgi:ABC-type transporter Mla maintaining outer membrane lipid asymmetry ATPase subunit MlaF